MENKEESVKFEHVLAEGGRSVLVLNRGLKREPIMQGYATNEFVQQGFLEPIRGGYGRPYNERRYNNNVGYDKSREVVNISTIYNQIAYLMTTLHKMDKLDEASYDALLEVYEPFISEALVYTEFSDTLEHNTLTVNKNKKRHIFRRP